MDTETRMHIIVVDDEPEIRESLRIILEKDGYSVSVAEAARPALKILETRPAHLVLTDFRLPDLDGIELLRLIKLHHPDTDVVILTGYGTIDSAVQAIRDGAYDFIQKPVKRISILRTVEKALEKQALAAENKRLKEELSSIRGAKEIIASSASMRHTLETARQVASSSASVLIEGESGTGKEVIANLIHTSSPRSEGPLIKVSCAAIPETLLEAELFGHEKGAFTGAMSQRKGRFELADTGTLFLDEVSEMSGATQVKLLRVLQEGEFERLGGTKTITTDVRMVAATNVNLEEAIENGTFRRDLYYRLNVITIQIPPLRERQDDIPLLAHYFLRRMCAKNDRTFSGLSDEAMDRMVSYSWPGNVRELENVIERAVVLSRNSQIGLEDLPQTISTHEVRGSEIRIPIGTSMHQAEDLLIDETLRYTQGNKEAAAHLLGIAARTIYRRLKRKEAAASQ